ncbi:MAG: hypothetical protein WA996_12090 [Candidatus Promineifilaceae bacterium]
MTETQEKARAATSAIINEELDEGVVFSLNETTLRSSWGYCCVSVTVWYSVLKE